MEEIRGEIERINMINKEYRHGITQAEARKQTIIQSTEYTVEREIKAAKTTKESLMMQYEVCERKYREECKKSQTARGIQMNLDKIHKIFSGEMETTELPDDLIPMLRIMALIGRENERITKAQERLEMTIKDEEEKMMIKKREQEEKRDRELERARIRYMELSERFNKELSEGIRCLKE
jgi:hypothetical protein